MSAALRQLGIELLTGASGDVELRSRDLDWLRLVLVALGFRARIENQVLSIASADSERLQCAVQAAIAPDAILLDLDGVLADIGSRRRIAKAEDLASLAAHYPIAVVTTCPRRLAESVLDDHGFLPFVSAIVGSEERPCKPDPHPVKVALQLLDVRTAWMLGDNPSDVLSARGAGVVPFAILPRGAGSESHMDRLRSAGAVRLLEGVDSLLPLLRSWNTEA